MEKIILPQVRDLGQTIGDPFLFFRANFKILIKAFLYYAVPFLTIEVILLLLGAKTSRTAYSGYGSTSTFRGVGGMVLLGYLFGLVVSLTQQFYVMELLILKEDHEDVTNAEVISKMKEDSGIFIGTLFAMVPVFVIMIIFVIMIFTIAGLFGNWATVPVFIGLFVFSGYAFVALSNLLFIRLREKLHIIDSLVKCFKIMAGSWWKTVAAWFVSATIFYGISFSIISFFGMGVFIANFHNFPEALLDHSYRTPLLTAFTGVTTTLGTFIFHFLANILTVFIGINYYSLSEKYDSYHLKAEINQLGQAQDSTAHRQEGEY